jgi:hypothetical protein
MYQIDKTTNSIKALSAKGFSELGFKERQHLQEWIANCPECLGEELLIIAKEFDGFDETKERLDLLALDKQGGLVVIENKLDDSGKDVVWQALKYASYCSSLSKSQILKIYQSYLSQNGGGDVMEKLEEFFDEEEFDQVILNAGIDQRIILVAANFRREVTSTSLWLLQHGIRLQCVRATAFDNGGQLFLNMEQIIPTPEAADYMIGIAEKAQEQQNTERSQIQSVRMRLQFWEKLLAGLGEAGIDLFSSVNPSKEHWLATGSGVSGIHYTLIFAKKEVRVVFDLERPNKEENKWLFDRFYEMKDEVEADFGEELKWLRKDDAKVSRVRHRKAFDCYDKESWPEIIAWFVEYVPRMEKAFAGRVHTIVDDLKTANLHQAV